MKKQVLTSAILAVLTASSAQAALPTINPANTSTVYVAGASAQRGYIQATFTGSATLSNTDRLCDPTQIIYQYNDSTGTNWNAWYCTAETANTVLTGSLTNLLVHKRSSGGSDYGVAPVIANSAVGFLDLSSCTETVAPVAGTLTTTGSVVSVTGLVVGQATCTGTSFSAVPDLGVSDVDPSQFVGKNVTTGFKAVKASDLTSLAISSTSTVVFGEQVTLKLYQALQAAQIAAKELPSTCTIGDRATEACMPNLTSSQIAALHTADINDWNQITVNDGSGKGLYDWTVANQAALAPTVNAVHIVRRANGSGTQTQHGIVFLNYPCTSAAETAKNHVSENEGVNGYVIHEQSSAGNVNAGLNALDQGIASSTFGSFSATWTSGPRWAVGLNSLEQVTSTNPNYEFVKVDGVAPTLANVVAGKYHDWVENTFQYNTTHYAALTGDVQTVINAILAKTALPDILSGLNGALTHGFGNGAYLAHPSLFTPTATLNPAFPVNTYTRTPFGKATQDCRAPNVFNNGTAAPVLGL